MKPSALKPYLTLTNEDVAFSATIDNVDLLAESPTQLPEWHADVELTLNVTVALDLHEAATKLKLSHLAPTFALFATAHSTATGFKWVSNLISLSDGEESGSWVLPAGVFGKDLHVTAGLIVRDRSADDSPLAPPTNAILIEKNFLCELEGSLSRAAVEVFDFQGDLEESLWEIALNLPKEPEDWKIADLSSCITVRLNRAKFNQLGSESSYNKALAADFMSAIIDASLSNEEVARALLNDFQPEDPGSLFLTCRSALAALFGDQDYETVMLTYSRNRQHHRAKIQAISSIAAREPQ